MLAEPKIRGIRVEREETLRFVPGEENPPDQARHASFLIGCRASGPDVVAVILRIDEFLASLGWLTGPPTLTVSHLPAWPVKSVP